MAAPTTTTVSLNSQPDISRRHKFFEVAVQFTDAGVPTYVTAGLTIDLTKMTNPKAHPRAGFPPGSLPSNDEILPVQIPGGYTAYLEKNTVSPTLKNYLLRIMTSSATELGNGANLPASLFAATVGASPKFIFRFRFKNYH